MIRIFTFALAAVLLWGVNAWAATESEWDEWNAAWDEFNGEDHSSSDVAERTLRASQPIYGSVMHPDGADAHELMYYPSYPHGYADYAYNPDQVYGPMWGVPGEAVGLDGYDPFYMMQFLAADASTIPDEYRAEVLRRRAMLAQQRGEYHAENPQHTGQVPAAHSHESSNEDYEEGDGIRDTSDDWLD